MSLLIVGCGKMGGIILECAVKSGLFSKIDVVEPSECGRREVSDKHKHLVSVHQSLPKDANNDIALVCVKPWMVEQVVSQLEHVKVIASIAAGITLEQLEQFNDKIAMVRIMPNTPCQVGQGMTAIVHNDHRQIDPKLVALIVDLFKTMGRVVEWPDERHLDAFTALCGSGPGMLLTILEAFADGALLHGIPKQLAVEFAAQTMLGTASMCLQQLGQQHPAELRDQVCTPAGCTIAGICSLHESGVPGAIVKAVSETVKRLQ